MEPKRFFDTRDSGRPERWSVPPEMMARALTLHSTGKSPAFIYRALFPGGAPVGEQTFARALGDLVTDMERLAMMRDSLTGKHGEYIERAIAGETVLPSDLAKSRDALLRTQEILLGRLEKEADGGEVRDLTQLSGGIVNVAGKLLAFQRYRVDVAIIRSNLADPEETKPVQAGPAVVLDFGKTA